MSGSLEIVVWIAPTIIGVAVIRYYKWHIRSGRKVA